MNRRFYCAVGVCSGVLLLGGGIAEAAGTVDEADRNTDPRAVLGLPTDISPLGEQHQLAVSINARVKRANNKAPGRGGSSAADNAPADRTEQLSGLGALGGLGNLGGSLGGKSGNAGKGGADGLLGGILGGLPAGALLGKLTAGGSPIGQLIGNGPLGGLMGGLNPDAAADGGKAGAVTVNSPKTQDPGGWGDDDATDWRQNTGFGNQRPGERPTGPAGTDLADPALNGVVANPTWRVPTLDQPATHQADTAATRGKKGQHEPAAGADDGADGFEEKQSATRVMPLAGNSFGPLGRLEVLGGDTLAGLPVLGDLLGGGLSLKTLDNLPALTDVVSQVGDQNAAKPGNAAKSGNTSDAPANLPVVGGLGRMLLGGESAKGATESAHADASPAHVAEHGALTHRAIDKAKVTPELVALFDSDALGVHADTGIIHQLPVAG